MLAMQQISRRTWCRGAFVVLCAAPTLLIASWIASRALFGGAASKEEWERELSSRLGMTFTIGEVSYPQIGLAVLTQVELSDLETGQPLARATAIEVTRTADGYAIEAVAPEVEAAQVGRLSQILHARLLCQGNGGAMRCDFSARELTLNDKDAPRTLVNLQATLESAETGPRLTASFQWPEAADAGHTLEWSLARNLDLSPPATNLSLNTGKARLPCHLAAHLWPPMNRLGPEAEYCGEVTWLLDEQNSAKLCGTFFGVDLDALVSDQFPQVLSGQATVRIERAIIAGGRLHSTVGKVEVSSGGRISRSLLLAAAEHLQLQSEAGTSGSEVLPYRRLAGSFRIIGSELSLVGTADAGNPGVLITSRSVPLLSVPPSHAASAASLARVLLPDSSLQVPLASQTSSLVRLLPAPATSPSEQTARRTHTPTRVSPGGSSTGVIRER